ncbi:MAG: hypothetical protein ACE362_01695 [Phaeodactylibacter xiamenensis]|uniref:Uncharacterized protein n=1 Tax=Phaeodactylibacter xiamenensis TaxID=1524460 RepID=A0A098SD71_9BACT|nr:hypothetical protein [Phaeodactylibacter xiamenensis]KGE88937.1 hypothetical protein IX84_05995 [Phaeodactylibacter xiamenensis]MCR9052694.1 hypothetical protein [bacterium]
MEEGPNNFERLLERQAEAIHPDVQERTEQGLFKTFESLRLVGQLLDVFVPKMVDVLVVAAGGDSSRKPVSAGLDAHARKGPAASPDNHGPSLPKEGLDEIR